MTKEIPKKLFLIIGDEVNLNETDFYSLDHEFVTWSERRIFHNDLEYVLKSESDQQCSEQSKEIETLKEKLSKAIDRLEMALNCEMIDDVSDELQETLNELKTT